MATHTQYSFLPEVENSPLFGCYLADVRYHLLLNFRNLIIFSNPVLMRKYLLIRISPVLDKDAFIQKPEKTDIQVIRASPRNLSTKETLNIQSPTFMAKKIILEHQHQLGCQSTKQVHSTYMTPNQRCEGFTQIVQIWTLDPLPILEKGDRMTHLKPEALKKASEYLSLLRKQEICIAQL